MGPKHGGRLKYPQHRSEFEVQAFLFFELKALGFDIRGEVKAKGIRGARFDLVIFDGKGEKISKRKPLRIIEVKARRKQGGVKAKKQAQRYSDYGPPVDLVRGPLQARKYVEKMKKECIV